MTTTLPAAPRNYQFDAEVQYPAEFVAYEYAIHWVLHPLRWLLDLWFHQDTDENVSRGQRTSAADYQFSPMATVDLYDSLQNMLTGSWNYRVGDVVFHMPFSSDNPPLLCIILALCRQNLRRISDDEFLDWAVVCFLVPVDSLGLLLPTDLVRRCGISSLRPGPPTSSSELHTALYVQVFGHGLIPPRLRLMPRVLFAHEEQDAMNSLLPENQQRIVRKALGDWVCRDKLSRALEEFVI